MSINTKSTKIVRATIVHPESNTVTAHCYRQPAVHVVEWYHILLDCKRPFLNLLQGLMFLFWKQTCRHTCLISVSALRLYTISWFSQSCTMYRHVPSQRSTFVELIMAALHSKCGYYLWLHYVLGQATYIFILSFVLLLSFFLFFPRLISAVGGWMSAILPHMVWP